MIEITLKMKVVLSYLAYFMLNGITIFCPAGLEANISCEISHKKWDDQFLLLQKIVQHAHE